MKIKTTTRKCEAVKVIAKRTPAKAAAKKAAAPAKKSVTFTVHAEKGKAVYTFNQSDGQGYFNKSKLTYRIMNNEGNKYVQFVLSAEPVVGQSVDVKMTSKGIKELSSSVTYKTMKVVRMEDNLLYLVGGGGADTKPTALILVWIE